MWEFQVHWPFIFVSLPGYTHYWLTAIIYLDALLCSLLCKIAWKLFSNVNHLIICNSQVFKSRHSEVLLEKWVLKICSRFTGEYLCRNVISIKLQSNFTEMALWHVCSPVNMLYICRRPFTNNTPEWLLQPFSNIISHSSSPRNNTVSEVVEPKISRNVTGSESRSNLEAKLLLRLDNLTKKN